MTWNVPDRCRVDRPDSDHRAELLAESARLNASIDTHLAVLRGERRSLLALAVNRERIESMRRHPSSQRPTLRVIEGGAA